MNRPQFEILIRIKNDFLANLEIIKQDYSLTREQYLNDFLSRNEDLADIEAELYLNFTGQMFNEYVYTN